MLRSLIGAYRRTGADPPFVDPAGAHGVGMEGYFWRFTLPDGRTLIALIGACRDFSLVAGAASWSAARWTLTPPAALSASEVGVSANGALTADDRMVSVFLDGFSLSAAVSAPVPWSGALGGLGLAHLVPGLGQYWHPWLLSGVASGSAVVDGETVSLDGASVYAEKNWGSVFAGHWWWGQAHGLSGDAACVAFAGGRLAGPAAATALVVALEDSVLRFVAPTALVRTDTGPGRWHITARSLTHTAELHAEADPAAAHLLPVPIPSERRAELRSRQHLTGQLTLTVRQGRRLRYAGSTSVAGLELGTPGADVH